MADPMKLNDVSLYSVDVSHRAGEPHGCEQDRTCMWEAGTGLHSDGTPCIYGQRVLAEDEQANDEDKRWEWSRDAFSWSAHDAADLGENQ